MKPAEAEPIGTHPRVDGRMHVLSFRMPRRFLRGSGARLGLTIAALACGVALVCAIDLANRAVFRAFGEVVDAMAGRASLQVGAGANGLVPEEIAALVAKVPGVAVAVPVVDASAFLADGSGRQIAVHGVDVADEAAVRVYAPVEGTGQVVADPLVFLSRPDSIVLTEVLATDLGLAEGDALELQTPSGRRRFVVRGRLAPSGLARVHAGALAIMDLQAAESFFTRPGFASRIDVVLAPGADPEQVRDALLSTLPPGLRAEPPVQRKLNLQRVMRAVQTLLGAVGLLGVATAALIAFSRLNSVFESRMHELAVLRATGLRRARVGWELGKEALLVGVAGTLLGLPLGIALGRAILPIVARTTTLAANLVATEAVLRVRPASLALAAAVGLGAIAAAAIAPAIRAARVSVVATLARRGGLASPAQGGPARRRLAAGLLAVAVVVAAHLRLGDPVSGLAASALLVVATAALARRFVLQTAPLLVRALSAVGGATGRLAAATLLRDPSRTALSVATIAVGFGTVLWMWTLARSFEWSVTEVMPGKLRGDLSVSSAHLDAGFIESPLDESILPGLRAVEGVAAVVGERAIDWEYAGGPIAIDALDRDYFIDERFGRLPLVGRSLPDALGMVARGEAVIVSENFVHNLGLGTGDLLALDAPRGPLRLRIAGVSPDFLSPRGTVDMSRELFREWWHDDSVVRGLVVVAPGASVAEVRSAISRDFGERFGVRVLTLSALVEWFAEQVRRAFSGLHVLAGLVLLVVLVGVGDTLAATTMERTREFGLVRAIGVRPSRLALAVGLEALALCALGLVLAGALGTALGVLWVKATFPALLGWTLQLHFPWKEAAGIAAAAVVVCLAASCLPAWRAARLDPAAALRME